MIENDDQLQQTREAIAKVETALAALRARVQPANPSLFAAMAEDYWSNIRAMRGEIDAYLGAAAGLGEIPLWMVLEGETISRGEISSRLLSEWLEKFRKALYGLSAFLETGELRLTGGRPDADLLAATDPQVVALAPGSIRVGLRLPKAVTQSELFEDEGETLPARALRQLLVVSRWAASETIEIPTELAMDRDVMTAAARFAARLAPSPKSAVRTVTFSGPSVPFEEPLRLHAASRTRLHGLVQMLSHVTEETIVGQIREIDLDARRVILRERGGGLSDMKCKVPEELMEVAEGLLNKQVQVVGLVLSSAPDTIEARDISAVKAT